MLQLYYSIMSI